MDFGINFLSFQTIGILDAVYRKKGQYLHFFIWVNCCSWKRGGLLDLQQKKINTNNLHFHQDSEFDADNVPSIHPSTSNAHFLLHSGLWGNL